MSSSVSRGRAKQKTALVFIGGSDEGAIKARAQELAREMTPEGAGEFGVEVIDGAVESVDQAVARVAQAVQAIRTPPLFGDEKLVWLKSATFLGGAVAERSAVVGEALERLADLVREGIPSGVSVLISAVDPDGRTRFFRLMRERARMEMLEKVDTKKDGWEQGACRVVEKRLAASKLRADEEVVYLLAQLTGGDTRQVDVEVEKLDLYLGERRAVERDDVDLLVPQSRAGVIFELGNAIGRRDLDRSLELLGRLLEQGEQPVGVLLATIVPTVRNLLLAKDLMERHGIAAPNNAGAFVGALKRLPEEALRHLPRKRDGGLNLYSLGFAAMGATRYKMRELRKALRDCLRANLQLVSTQRDGEVVLSGLITGIVGREADPRGGRLRR